MIKIYEYYKSRIAKESEYADKYDEKFGVPSTEVFEINDLLDFIDEVIEYTEEQSETLEENVNEKYNLQVDKVVATDPFEKALKILFKKHRIDILKEIKSVVIDLGNYKTQQKHNHPLKNASGCMDIHIGNGKYVLMYRYVSEKVVMLGFSEEQMQAFLKLQDLVDHKQLKRYNKKKYNLPYHEFEIDKLDSNKNEETQ